VQWITLGDYLQRKLLGAPGISHSVASWSGMLNRHTLQWDNALLDVLPIDRHALPPLIDLDEVGETLLAPWATRWPALAGARWFAAVGDGAAANLGSDCASPACVALTVGTTSAMRVVSAEWVSHVPDGLWCYRVDRPRALVGGALTEGGNLFAWARRTLSLPRRLEVIERKIAALEPDGHGLTFLPLLGGERAPGWRGELRGTLDGVSLATRPEEILRAGLEGVALRIALVYSRLQPLLDENATVIASGGALLHSPAWLQIMADVLGCPVQPSPVDEASARGVVVLALAALGSTATPLSFTAPPYSPNATAHARYQEAAARQEALYVRVAEQN
jgi:gluconokinase